MIPNKYEKKIEAADLPQKTKDQLRTFLDEKESAMHSSRKFWNVS